MEVELEYARALLAAFRPKEAELIYKEQICRYERFLKDCEKIEPKHYEFHATTEVKLQYARSMLALAQMLNNSGDENEHESIEQLHEKAIGILQTCFGPNHQSVITVQLQLAQLLRSWQLPERATKLFREVLKKQETTGSSLGSSNVAARRRSHPKLLFGLNQVVKLPEAHCTMQQLAITLCELGQTAEAEKLVVEAVHLLEERATEAEDSEHVQIQLSRAWTQLSEIYEAQAVWQKAHHAATQALEVLTTLNSVTSGQDLPVALYQLVAALKGLGRVVEAQRQLEHGLALQDQLGPDSANHDRTAQALTQLAVLLRMQGDLSGACKACHGALDLYNQPAVGTIKRAPFVLGWAKALLELSAAQEEQLELEAALKHCCEAHEMWSNQVGTARKDRSWRAESAMLLAAEKAQARLLAKLGRNSEAEKCLRRVTIMCAGVVYLVLVLLCVVLCPSLV